MSGDPDDTKPIGLASFLEDVIITKTEKATKSKLDQAKQEMEAYMTSDMLNFKKDPLLWLREHSWRFPLSAFAKERSVGYLARLVIYYQHKELIWVQLRSTC